MKFDITKFEPQFESIIQQFLGDQISAEQFSDDFTTLWMSFRDQQYKVEEPDGQRYRLELIERLQKGDLTGEEFRQKYQEVMKTTEGSEFREMVDAIHSACSAFNPLPAPRLEWEITTEQLRAEVQELFTNYYQNKK